MSIQSLENTNDYKISCGSVQITDNASVGTYLLCNDNFGHAVWSPVAPGAPGATGPQGPIGPTGATGPASNFNNHLMAGCTAGAATVNFGSGTGNVPFDIISYNPSGNWVLENGGTSTADLKYVGPNSGVTFLVTTNPIIQYNGAAGNFYCNVGIHVNGPQVGQLVALQPETTGVLCPVANSAIVTMNVNDILSVIATSSNGAASDWTIQNGLGGGNISIVQIA